MRVFLSDYSGFSLAIPMRLVSSIMIYSDVTSRTIEKDQENSNTYISLPHLFDLQSEDIRHGIILKNLDTENDYSEDDSVMENKIILLTTEVKCETEIPGEEIFPMPKAFGKTRFSTLFSGVKFDTGDPVLFLNIKAVVHEIQKETAA